MKKTLVTFMITLIMIATCMTTVQAASFGVKITSDKTEVKKGETVKFIVSVDNMNFTERGLTALYGILEYDKTVFNELTIDRELYTAAEIEALNKWDAPMINPTNNKLLTSKAGYVKTASDVFSITLTVKETAKTGSTTITLKDIVGSDNENDIPVVNASCSVQIAEKTVEPPVVTPDDGGNNQPTVTVKPKVTASQEKVANGVKVTLTSDKELKALDGWELSADKKKLTRIYTKDFSGTITVKDANGIESEPIVLDVKLGTSDDKKEDDTTTDKTAPTATVKYTKGTNGVTVTVTASEQIKAVKGWTLSGDKKTLTRVFTADYTETITLEDLAGNKSAAIKINVDIDAKDGAGSGTGNNNGGNGSQSKEPLPSAGATYIIPAIAIIAVIGTGAFIRYKSMEY